VQKLLNWTKDYFGRCGQPSPRLAAEVLLAHVLNCRRIDLYTRFDSQPTDEQRSRFRQLAQRAADHEPVAYLVERKEFYSMSFRVTPDVLIPRPETELLVAEAIEHLKEMEGARRIWDVCTGCGCVAIAVAAQMRSLQPTRGEKLQALCTDISPAAVEIAAENARVHGLDNCMHFRTADLLSLPDDCRQLAPFGVITANPPYVAAADEVAESVRYEPPDALAGLHSADNGRGGEVSYPRRRTGHGVRRRPGRRRQRPARGNGAVRGTPHLP